MTVPRKVTVFINTSFRLATASDRNNSAADTGLMYSSKISEK
jgi:hypothetical protein